MKKYLFLIIVFASCRGATFKIPATDKQMIPYNGTEMLVFKSNRNNTDTIFLQGYDEFNSPDKQWSFPLKYIDHRVLSSRRTDPNYDRYLDSLNFITLINDGDTKITFDLTAKHSWFWGAKTFTKSEFNHLKDTALQVGNVYYRDVLIIHGYTDSGSTYANQKFHKIKTIYWSKANGLIRFDNDNSECWELAEEK